MDLKACYIALGGDFDEVMGRLHREQIVEKFILKFLDDDSFRLLKESIDNGNYEEAFRAAHTIKGICQNLSFTKLYKSSNLMTEAFRNGKPKDAEKLLPQVSCDYLQTIEAIKKYRDSLEEMV